MIIYARNVLSSLYTDSDVSPKDTFTHAFHGFWSCVCGFSWYPKRITSNAITNCNGVIPRHCQILLTSTSIPSIIHFLQCLGEQNTKTIRDTKSKTNITTGHLGLKWLGSRSLRLAHPSFITPLFVRPPVVLSGQGQSTVERDYQENAWCGKSELLTRSDTQT